MAPTRAAGLVIFRKFNEVVQYLMLQTSYGEHHWTPPKGKQGKQYKGCFITTKLKNNLSGFITLLVFVLMLVHTYVHTYYFITYCL